MYRGYALRVMVIVCAISTALNFLVLLSGCPDMPKDPSVWKIETLDGLCYASYTFFIYTQMPMRASPYMFGMYAAYCYLFKKGIKPSKGLFYTCLFSLLIISFVGVTPFLGSLLLSPLVNTIWTCIGRQIYGLCLSYTIFCLI